MYNSSARPKLSIVRRSEFRRYQSDLLGSNSSSKPHSLYSMIDYPQAINPDLVQNFIERFTAAGDVILDPFCASGNISLAAAASGRVPYAFNTNPYELCLTAAKLQPADITQITLFMQTVNLKAPIVLDADIKDLLHFFHQQTLTELLNLRKILFKTFTNTARFVEMLVAGILHGNSAAYLSTFTNPKISLSVSEQISLNMDRNQRTDHRALIPRVLKKTAMVTADGIPSALEKMQSFSILKLQDARDLSCLRGNQPRLILSSLPQPGHQLKQEHFWLKHWFSDVDCSQFYRQQQKLSALDDWLEYLNECLFEFARVMQSSDKIVFHIKDIEHNGEIIDLAEILKEYIDQNLSSFWAPLELHSHQASSVQLKNALKSRSSSRRALHDRFLVLERA